MKKLYFGPGACSFVPHACLALAGAAFEPIMVKLHKGEQQAEAFLSVNPRGQVPVLVDGDLVLDQVVAITLHVDATYPQAQLLPAEGVARAQALRTLVWMNNTVHPTFTHVFMPHKYTDDPQAQEALRRFNTGLYEQRLGELEALVQQAGGGWLGGAKPGALDAYALTLLRWGSIAGIDPLQFTQTWALAQRFAALAPVAEVAQRERLQLNLMA